MADLEAGAARLHGVMAAHVATGRPPGLVMALVRGDELHVDVIGAMDTAGGAPMRRDTIFRIASLTKPIIAVATMILVEEGLLGLDMAVTGLLPELAHCRVQRDPDGPLDDTVPARRPITVEDLLTFRSGHAFRVAGPDTPVHVAATDLGLLAGPAGRRHTPDEWMRRLGALPLQHQPGERFAYDAAADMLGVLIARATGRPLDVLLAERIFDQLGMIDTAFAVPASEGHRLPPAYTAVETAGGIVNEVSDTADGDYRVPPPFPSGDGGLVSTLDDYLAFARNLLGPDPLVSKPTLQLMITDHLQPEQHGVPPLNDRGWGLGLSTGGGGRASRYGWDGITGTVWFSDAEQRSIAILLTQQSAGPLTRPIFADFRTTAAEILAG